MVSVTPIKQTLLRENAELRARLEELEDTLRAIRAGEVDALVVEASGVPQIFTLQSSDAESSRFRGEILGRVNDAVIALDDEQRVTYLNAAGERLYGVTASEALGRFVAELYESRSLHPGDEDVAAAALRETGHWRGENIHIKRDGLVIQVETSLSRLFAGDGAPSGLLNVVRDITARSRAEKALRQNEMLFSAIIDQAPGGVFVVDADFRLQQINPQTVPVFGHIHLLIGRDFSDVLQILWGSEVGGKIAKIFRHTLETGERYISPRFSERRQDLGVEQSFEWEVQRVTLPGGDHGVVCYFDDVTARTQAEEALRASEERFRVLFDSGPIAIFSCDRDAVIQAYNRRAAELWGREPVCGDDRERYCGSLRLFHADGRHMPHEQSPIAGVLKTGVIVKDAEVYIERPDGSRLAVAVTFAPLKSAQGEITGAITAFYDISERRLLEHTLVERAGELERADRSKDEFLAMLAHELRSPLAPLRNASEILRTVGGSDKESAQAQQIIARQIENMSRMIDDLLDVSRITEGKIELRPQVVALEAIFTAAANVVRPGIEARGQELAIALPAESIFLNADATRLEQVFGNLLTNASKYSDSGCHISLSAERVTGNELPEVIVRVRDDGMGIAPDLLPRIFDLFVQSTRALDRAQGGLGIGLTLVRRLVMMHGGSVEAHSEGIGHGSEFVLRLPILSGPSAVSPPRPTLNARETPRRMLIVDDNEDSVRSMSLLQTLRGHETRIVFTGPDAVAAAAEFTPDVVLLDIGLPGMDGFEVARRLRAMPALADTFLVAISGYDTKEDHDRAQAAGFDEYLVKPVALDVLREWLQSRS